MKYVMLEAKLPESKMVVKIPLIFPNALVHSIVADQMVFALLRHGIEAVPVSAGTASVSQVEIGGNSETLGLSSNPDDKMTIELIDYLHGLESVVE